MTTRSSLKNDLSGGTSPEINVKFNEDQHLTPLKTKLYVPAPQAKWILRSRLIGRMKEGFKGKLTLISAPAGFGKTTLLADWVHRYKIPVAWFSVDKADNDPLNFLTYIILGLQTLNANIGKAAMMMIQSPQTPSAESILISLINDVIRMPTDTALVIDDYHIIENKPVHDLIGFLLENLPPMMHVFIATRSEPLLPLLPRLRSQNQLTEFRAADLSFSTDETSMLFKESLNLRLSSNDIHLLEMRTEGWAAGLQLAALSLQGRTDPSGFIESFKGDNRHIADYLTEEVLNRQAEYLRNFLLQTSILGRLCGSLCDAVTQQNNSRQILNTLEKANLFVIPLDDQRRWYRYHHLFADLLLQRLQWHHGGLVADLHRRASRWLARNGFGSEAVDHALIAQDYTSAARLIEEIAEKDWDRAWGGRLIDWIEALPDEQIEANPMLCIFYAREFFKSGDLDGAEKRLQAAEQIIDSSSISGENEQNLQGRIAVIRAYISSRTGNVPRIIHFAKLALMLLPQRDSMWRSVAATNLGFAYGWAGAGNLVKAQQAFSEAMKISQTAGNIYYQVFCGSCLGGVMQVRGMLKEATDICRQSLSLAIENGIEHMGVVGSLYGNLGMILSEWNNLDEGIRLINKGIELSEQGRDPVILGSIRISLLRALIYRVDIAGAFNVIEKLNESVRHFMLPPWITNTTSALNVLFWLAAGDLKKAIQWVKERGLSIDDKLENLRGFEYVALTHILIAQKKLDDADRFSQRIIDMAQAGDNVILQIEIRLVRLSIFFAQKDNAAALVELKLALALGEPGGFIMIFVSKGKPVADLLEEIIAVKKSEHDDTKAGFSLAYVKKLLSIFKAGPAPEIKGLVDPLSERELEVLHLIAAGLSNREIAEKLFISLNTVKTHTKNINSKLNVKGRIKAIGRAKELGLL